MVKVILISGKAQHGKDTFAAMLRVKLRDAGKSVKITHFGDLLKYICKEFFEWDGRKDEAGRSLLQHVGTEIFRENDPNYWCRFIYEVSQYINTFDYLIVADTRFLTEINQFPEAYKVRVIRIFNEDENYALNDNQQSHVSENDLNSYHDWDYIITARSGDIDKLYEAASRLANKLTEEVTVDGN